MSRTVSTLAPTDLDLYRKALKGRMATTRSHADSRLKRSQELAGRAALILKEEFDVKKVVAFGSIVNPRLFHAHSDVDIAVWGLTGRRYYRAVGILQSLDPDIEVDLVAFENASNSIRETILREGKEL